MKNAGYSGTPLWTKLGYHSDQSLHLIHPPVWFKKEAAAHITLIPSLPTDWVHGFFRSRRELADFLSQTDLDQIKTGFWASWPKKASTVQTDLTEQTFRDLILPTGWVDVKVAAIDDTWSGLKFLRRKN